MDKTFSAKQKFAFNNCNRRINILEGAIRSGKSFICFYIWIKFILEAPAGNMAMCGRTILTLERNVLKVKGGLFDILGHKSYRYLRNKNEIHVGDRIIYCFGASDEAAEEKLRGATLVGAFCDEVTLYPESFVKQLDGRCSITGSKLFFTCNPDSPNHYIKTEFIDKLRENDKLSITVHSFLLEDNPVLSGEYKVHLESLHSVIW